MAETVLNNIGQENFIEQAGGKKMIRKKDIQQINNTVQQIESKVDTLTSKTMWKAQEYDRLMNALKCVKINIAKAYATFDEESMRYVVKIDYNVPQAVLYIADDGETELNSRFKAMNDLKLIPLDDLAKVQDAINKAIKLIN
jgi:hypothetical protein